MTAAYPIDAPLGTVTVEPIDRDTVRVEVRMPNPLASPKWRYEWRLWTDVRRDRVPPVWHDWFGAPLEGEYGSKHRGEPMHPRRISIGNTSKRWAPVLDQLETTVTPLVRQWMTRHDADLIDTEIALLHHRSTVLSKEEDDLARRLTAIREHLTDIATRTADLLAERNTTTRKDAPP